MNNRIITLLMLLVSFGLNAQTNLQTVKGQIIDKASEIPLIGANIELIIGDQVLGTTTDLDGQFYIREVIPGRHMLRVSYLGYETQNIPNVLVSSGKEVVLNIGLEEALVQLDEIVIRSETPKDKAINEMATVSARTFSLEEVVRYSGGRNDVSRLVSNYAGVSTADDSRNDIVIRGNSPTSVQWRLEGVAIPNPNHFATLGTTGGPVSALNTNLLKNSDFMTSAFPAEYGNALSGVFDIGFRSGNKDTFEGTFQLAAFSGVEAMVEGPINKSNKSSYLVSFRNSFVGLANELGIPIGTNATPDYRDLSFKLDLGQSKYGKFELFGIGATSDISFLATETDPNDLFAEPDADATAESRLGILGLKHSLLLNDRSYLRTTILASHAQNNFIQERYTDETLSEKFKYASADDVLNRQVINSYYNNKLSARSTIRIGATVERMDVETRATDSDGNPDLDGDGFEDNMTVRDFNADLYLVEAYVQEKFKLNNYVTINAGIHMQYLDFTEKTVFEPRLAMSYSISNSDKLNVGYGLHSQVVPLPFLFQTESEGGTPILMNKNLDFIKSHHFVLGWDKSIGVNWRSKLEVYYQSLFDVPVEREQSSFSTLNFGADFGFPSRSALVNEGTGKNYGIEFTLEKFFSNQFYGLITSSVFQSKYTGSDGIERNTAFANNVVMNFLAGKEFNIGKNNRLSLDLKYTYAGGRRFTPVDLEASLEKDSEVLLEEQAFSQRYPYYMRLDFKIGIALNSNKRKFSQQFFLDFQNLTNRENVFVNRYNRITNEVNTVYQSGFFPDIMYRIQF